MEEAYEYRLLQGKNGASGHVRGKGGERRAFFRGLKPGTEYAFYLSGEEAATLLHAGKSDATGQLSFPVQRSGRMFGAEGNRLILWEEGEGSYFQACSQLERLIKKQKAEAKKEELPVAPALDVKEQEEEDGKTLPSFPPLRSPGEGEGVDALPALFWPERFRPWQAYFEDCSPICPFYAPGWKFVRIPSPIREAAYGILGRLSREGRVVQLAQGVPGHPIRPPAFLPGYRYLTGMDGRGYWMMLQ